MHNLYHEYNQDLFNYLFFMIGNREQAKDIVHDAFARAFEKYESFNGDNPKSWLYRIARNLAIDHIRRKKPFRYYFDFIPVIPSNERGPEQIVMFNETERHLYKAMHRLKHSYREVIVLRKIKELSVLETSQVLGWSENKVKVTLFRAMKELKKELEKEGFANEAELR
ncbi:RNA polymerase subunit sigma [Bacillus sp. FJAT-27225]|nr:RNA polymerase subunit sigma [Bacillus sp. FJAT-27225]